MRRGLLIFLTSLLLPSAARAEWREATSAHFIVYSQDSEEKIRAAITRLEKYDFVLRFVCGVKKPSSKIKLKVFTVADMLGVQKTMAGGGGSGVAGYYNAYSRGPFAVIPQDSADAMMSPESTLFHEYTHHFMFQYFPAAYPSWYSEGFAEYYGSTQFKANDLVEVGELQLGRYRTMRFLDWLPLRKLLTAQKYADVGQDIYQLYAEGWLLVHYVSGNQKRADQLAQYLAAINKGDSYEKAMVDAFGPGARELDIELRNYSRQHQLQLLKLPFKPIDVGPIRMRRLGPAEQALMPYEITLSRGLLVREAKELADEVRAVAARYPNDAYALAMLTEAERDAGNQDAALAAADRWLAIQPGAARALMFKAAVQVDRLQAAHSTDKAAWAAARKLLVDASRRDPRDPMILEAFYDSYTAEGGLPPDDAQNALFSAFELAPQVDELRYKLARDFELRGLVQDAIDTIKPSAVSLSDEEIKDPKKKAKQDREWEKWRGVGETKHETPREMLTRLEAKLAPAAATPAKAGG